MTTTSRTLTPTQKQAKLATQRARRAEKRTAVRAQVQAIQEPVHPEVVAPVTVVASVPAPGPTNGLARQLGRQVRMYLRRHARSPYGQRGQKALDRLIVQWIDAGAEPAELTEPFVAAYLVSRPGAVWNQAAVPVAS